ncbi:helix-turn-helix transcriptional regulator, partial [Micromonospora sp. NPDC003776]
YERAAALTPQQDADGRGRLRLSAVRCRYDSGEYVAAGAGAEAIAGEFAGELRAESLLLRAIVAWSADEPGEVAVGAAERALESVPPGSPLAGRIHAHLAGFVDAPGPARRHAEAALALLTSEEDDRGLLAASLLQLFFQEVRTGLPARTELVDRALTMEGDEPSWLAGTIPAVWWKSIDDADRARQRLRWMLGLAMARGDQPVQHELLSHLGETELLAGCWSAAEKHIAAARDLGEQLGTGLNGELWLAGLLHANRGDLAEAAAVAEAGLRRADDTGDGWVRRIYQHLAGFVALCGGRMGEAARAYGSLAASVDQLGLVEPLAQRFEPDWIEACVGAGDLTTARAALARLAKRHERLPRPWTTLGLARSRVLLESASGTDPLAALDELTAARAGVPEGVLPLDRARCLLVAGVVHRRARRKRAAQDALRAAEAEFAAIGARAFVERARAEQGRIGGRPPAPLDLTATEERVARLAAQGRTNRVIADELFISPKTVEANLARIYRKLGISSRAELGAAMAGRSGAKR